MINKSDYNQFSEKMDRTIAVLGEQLATVRAGRANPAILDKITVEYYGTETPINQVGNITVPEARMLVFQPWDATVLKAAEKAIQKSDIGINPNNDGKTLKLIFPPLTEERRVSNACASMSSCGGSQTHTRNIRRDAIDYFNNLKKKNEITEDEQKEAEKEIQNITDKHIAQIDKVIANKEKELMEI